MRPLLLLFFSVLPCLGVETAEPVPVEPGDVCVVCDRPVSENASAFLLGGQRFAVDADEKDMLLSDPQRYIASYRPNNIFMHGHERGWFSSGWLWFALFMTVMVVATGMLAVRRLQRSGLPPGQWKLRLTRDPVPCPSCGGTNHPAASQCAGCGAALNPVAPSETKVLGKD